MFTLHNNEGKLESFQVLMVCLCFRFTIMERRSLKSTPLRLSDHNMCNTAAFSDFDMLDHNAIHLPDPENIQFSASARFPTSGFQYNTCTGTERMMTHTPGDTLDYASSLQRGHNRSSSARSYYLDTEASPATQSRRPSLTDSVLVPDNGLNGSSLVRLGSEAPSLAGSNTLSNSNNNSYPSTPPFTPASAIQPQTATLGSTSSSTYVAGYPIPSSHFDSPPVGPTFTHVQANDPQAANTTFAGSANPAEMSSVGSEWSYLPPSGTCEGEVAEPGRLEAAGIFQRGTRTTITLDNAEPGTVLDVMKVLVSSNARVKYEIE